MTATDLQQSGSDIPMRSPGGPGAQLQAAREAAGLTIDDVAQQLKLAPRQVRALEEENFSALPGRTFSRGFIRNYARLLNLDAQDLVTHLPDSAQAPALESPTLHSTGSLMAELPSANASKPGLGRWLIPLVLIGCIVAAAAYEWYRGGLTPLTDPQRAAPESTDRKAAPALDPAQTPAPQGQSMALPNPLASDAPGAKPAAPPMPGAPTPGATAPADASAGDPTAPLAPPATRSPARPSPARIAYHGSSWTEIRDGSGQLIVARVMPKDFVQAVEGSPPFRLVLGNARMVTLSYGGRAIDLAPYTRQNVARLTLK